MNDKKADLAGPGIGNYEELDTLLPRDYNSQLTPRETQQALFTVKNYIEENGFRLGSSLVSLVDQNRSLLPSETWCGKALSNGLRRMERIREPGICNNYENAGPLEHSALHAIGKELT